MKICKTRLLLLTGVLTASTGLALMVGCSSKSEDGPAPHEVDAQAPTREPDDTEPGSSGSSGTSGSSGSSSGSSGSSGASGSSGDAGKKDGGDGGGDGGGAAACLDDKSPATQPACPGGGQCQNACDDFATNYKKGISADIRKCLTVAICQASTATCTDKALAKSCVDATATAFCTPNVNGCKASNAADTITQASCEAIAKGLTAAGRAVLQTCFETQAVCGDCPATMK